MPLPPGVTPQQKRYLSMRGTVSYDRTYVRLDSRCPNLSDEGYCDVWTTRPQVCNDYPVGGPGCIAAIQKHRSPPQQSKILAKMGNDRVADT